MAYTLIDAEERHRENPKTSEIPPLTARQTLGVGQLVKLGFMSQQTGPHGRPLSFVAAERMWVRVTVRRDSAGMTQGVLENDPVSPVTLGVQRGDSVVFEPRHVFSIEEAES